MCRSNSDGVINYNILLAINEAETKENCIEFVAVESLQLAEAANPISTATSQGNQIAVKLFSDTRTY